MVLLERVRMCADRFFSECGRQYLGSLSLGTGSIIYECLSEGGRMVPVRVGGRVGERLSRCKTNTGCNFQIESNFYFTLLSLRIVRDGSKSYRGSGPRTVCMICGAFVGRTSVTSARLSTVSGSRCST